MINLARKESGNAVNQEWLLADSRVPLLELALTPAEETIMRLGLNVHGAFRDKVCTTN